MIKKVFVGTVLLFLRAFTMLKIGAEEVADFAKFL